MSDDEMAEVILQTGSIMGDELCQRCGTRFMVDHYCANGHMKPVRKDNPTTGEWTVERLEEHLGKLSISHAAVLANEINAALAAAYKKGYNDCDCELNGKSNPTTGASWYDAEMKQLREQLAAEREKYERLQAGYQQLAREQEKTAKQLAAERELVADAAAQILAKQLQLDAAVEALKQVDYYGESLIARNYDPASPTVVELVAACRAALAKIGGKPDDVEIYYDNRGGDTK